MRRRARRKGGRSTSRGPRRSPTRSSSCSRANHALAVVHHPRRARRGQGGAVPRLVHHVHPLDRVLLLPHGVVGRHHLRRGGHPRGGDGIHLPRHRHLSEIEQELGKAAGEKVTISFVPHLIPVTAGISTTIFAKLTGDFNRIAGALRNAYRDAPFVRLRGAGNSPDTKNVTGSNYLDIGWHHDSRTGRIIIQSAEDNLGKGAAGQAIQSFNLMVGNSITDGLQNL